MSFRKFGGLQYAAKHNIVSSNYNTSNNLLVTEKVGQPNSNINFESDIYLDGNLHILATGPTGSSSNNGIYFPDGSFQNTAASSSGEGINGVTGIYSAGLENGAQITTTRYLQLGAATQDYPGVVTTGSQTFSGSKSFSTDISVQGLRLGLGGQSSGTANPYNTAFGYYALSKTSSSSSIANNVAIGYQSLKKTTTGTDNVSVGANSLMNNTTGSNNIGIGSGALAFNADSSNNTGIGYNALYNNTSGYWNLAIGTNSLYSTQTSSNNIAIGYKALYWTTIGANLAVGNNALYSNSSGYYNLGIGSGALFCNTTGLQNAGIGLGSLYNNTTGNNNVAFGMNSLYNNETGSNNVAFGYNAGPTGTNKASLSNSIAIGYNATTTASNTIQMGNSDIIQMNTSGTIGVGNYSSDSAASGITGSIYYNTTDDVLKVYDGSNWNSIGSGGSGVTGPTGTIAGVTSLSSSGLAYGATATSNGYLQFAYSMGGGTGNTPGLQPGSYSDIFSTQTIDLGAAYPNGNFGANWTEITSAGYYNWSAVSVSSSGQYQTAVVNGGYIYISSDYGNTWTDKQTDTNRTWLSVSVSSSGQYQTAVCAAIYISSDYGNTWTQSGTLSASFVAISSSGQYQTVIADGGHYIYISSDYGNSFTQKDSYRLGWSSISMSSSGQYQTAVAYSDYIHISSNYGNTWTAATSPGTKLWQSVAISSSGQYQTAVVYDFGTLYGYIYVSSNYGISWKEQNFINICWNSVAMSSSGQYQVAVMGYNDVSSQKYIYVSSDYGSNWTATPGSGSQFWISASISSCGQYITAVYSDTANGYISTCYNSPSTKGVLYVGNYSSTSGVTGIAGSMYYDTTDSAMKYSDGTQWNTVGSGSGVTGPTGAEGPSGSGLAGVTTVDDNGFANAAQITSSNYLQLGAATETYPGVVTTGAQTFAGSKSFVSDLSVNSLTIGRGGNNVLTNTAIGYQALTTNTSGTSNSSFGYQAGITNTTGSYNTYIGNTADADGSSYSYSTALGSGATITDSNQIVLGTTSETVKYNKLSPLYTSLPTFNSDDIGYEIDGTSITSHTITTTPKTIQSLTVPHKGVWMFLSTAYCNSPSTTLIATMEMIYGSELISIAVDTLSTTQSSDKTITISFIYQVRSSDTLSIVLYATTGSFTYNYSEFAYSPGSRLKAVRIA